MKKLHFSLIVILVVMFLSFSVSLTHAQSNYPTPIPLPTNLSNPTASELLNIGLLDVTRPPAGLQAADKTGNTDSTQALKAIIEYAYNNRYITFFPLGTYVISDTLNLLQDDREFPMPQEKANYLVGSNKDGQRPVIKLKSNSPGFSVQNDYKAMLFIQNICDSSRTSLCHDLHGMPSGLTANPGGNMRQGINNIDLLIDSGNPSAVGIDFDGAQNSVLKNIKIISKGGYSGFYNLPGFAAVVGNLEVDGGKYGIGGESFNGSLDSRHPVINNLRLTNQTVAAIANLTPQSRPATIVGFEIIKDTAPAVITTNSNRTPGNGNISFHDGTIEIKNPSTNPIFNNTAAASLSLDNVYVKGNEKAVNSPNHTLAVPSTNWQLISQYSVVDSGTLPSVNIINNQSSNNTVVGAITQTTPNKAFLWNKHFWGYNPWTPDVLLSLSKVNNKVCVATNHARITVNDANEDSTGLQELADACQVILLPKGDYLLASSIKLNQNIEIVGVSNLLPTFRAVPSWAPDSPTAFFDTPNRTNAVIRLFDFGIRQPSTAERPNHYAIDWQSGYQSILHNVFIYDDVNRTNDLSKQNHLDRVFQTWATGNGGGKWYGGINVYGFNKNDPQTHINSRIAKIEGTTQPLQIYGPNPENINTGDVYPDVASQVEIINARNVAIYGSKSENPNPYKITNSQNILLTGIGGRVVFKDSSNIATYNSGMSDGMLVTKNDRKVIEIPENTPTSLYKDGIFNGAAFDALAYNVSSPPSTEPTTTPSSTPTPTTPPTTAPHPMPGDTNGDRIVNLVDYNQVLALFNSVSLNADFNRNNIVDIFDINKTISFFPVSAPNPSPTATPTPSSTPTPTPTTVPTATPSPTATPPQGSLKTKKWHPGHYLQMASGANPEELGTGMRQAGMENMTGARIFMFWSDFELNKNQYTREKLDQYLAQLPQGKRLVIQLRDRDYWGRTCDKNARLPSYIINHPTHPALNIDVDKGCVAQFWQPDIQDRWIKLNQKVAEYVEDDDRVEAIQFPETAFGLPEGFEGRGAEFKKISRDAWIAFHTAIAPSYQKTQVFQQINQLGPNCEYLDVLTERLRVLGHGISNPDSPPWNALPTINCDQSDEDYRSTYPGLANNDSPKPNFSVYSRFKGTMPIMVGGDTSSYEDPENPRTFNEERMNYANLVKYLYYTAVKGYTYTPSNPDVNVPGFGANYQFWNDHFSSTLGTRNNPDNPVSVAEYSRKFKEAFVNFLSDPKNKTNSQCPSNIKCQP